MQIFPRILTRDNILISTRIAILLQVFAVVDSSLEVIWSAADGDSVTKGEKFGVVQGSAVSILTGERVALNILQRMSGIATATAAMVKAAQVIIFIFGKPDTCFGMNLP